MSPPLPVKPVSVPSKYGPCGAILWPNGTLCYLTDSNDLGYLLDCCGFTINDCRFVMDKPKEGGSPPTAPTFPLSLSEPSNLVGPSYVQDLHSLFGNMVRVSKALHLLAPGPGATLLQMMLMSVIWALGMIEVPSVRPLPIPTSDLHTPVEDMSLDVPLAEPVLK